MTESKLNTLLIPCDTNEVSDGYHTFGELYNHRHALFLAFMKMRPDISWFSHCHHDGGCIEGWIVAGMNLEPGTITYHIPSHFRWHLEQTGVKHLPFAPKWDGHTSEDVVRRLLLWVGKK